MQCRDCKNCLVTFKQDWEERGNEYAMGFCRPLLTSTQVRLERECERFEQRPDPTQIVLELHEPTSLELYNIARSNNQTVGDSWARMNG